MILVQEEGEAAPEGPEYKHGLTPAMRDARRRRFRREPDLNPDLVQQVENDLQSIMAGGTARDVDVEVVEQDADDEDEEPAPHTTAASKKSKAAAAAGTAAVADEAGGDGDGDGDDDFDDLMDEDDEDD
ncbi:hypothetical protein M758_6G069900 [Ceratodon purpureus]|nr:hypothetical protein M758_6G069900 [Ceratodon purpureus]